MAKPILTITPVAYNQSTPYDLTALTGGVGKVEGLLGYTGADFYWAENSGGKLKQMGGKQALFTTFADSGTVTRGNPYSNTPPNPLSVAAGDSVSDYESAHTTTNWQAINCSGANQGIKWSPIANTQLKHMLVALEIDAGSYTVKASLSDGSVSDQTYVTTPAYPSYATRQQWFSVDWRAGPGDDLFMNLEIRKTDSSAGYFFIQFCYIGVPVDPPIPRGATRILAYTGMFGGANS